MGKTHLAAVYFSTGFSSIQNLLYKNFPFGKLVSEAPTMDDHKEDENEAELLDEGLNILEPTINLNQLEALIEDVWSLSVTEEDPIKSFRTTLHDVKAWAASEDLIKEGVENCSLLLEPQDFLHFNCTIVCF